MKEDKLYLKMLMENIVQNDDDKSFGKLFKLFYERLVEFSIHYVHSKELAEEIVSDVFVKIWNNRKQAENIQSIEAYLYIAVKNQSLNNISTTQLSHIRIDGETPDLSNLIEVFDPEKELEVQELQFNINIAIDSLAPQCKAVFKLIKEEGFKYKEVADILNISPRTVETQLVRALKRLDLALTPYINKNLNKSSKPKNGGMLSKLSGILLSFF